VGIPVVPAWGYIEPREVMGYRVVVEPKAYHESCWEFICLVPKGDPQQEHLVLVSQMCEAALNVGDRFSVYRLTHGDDEELANHPVMWLGEHEDKPQWLTPPVFMMN